MAKWFVLIREEELQLAHSLQVPVCSYTIPLVIHGADVSHADMQYWTKDIVIDPSDPTQNTWYVCVFSGWGGAPNGKGGLFKTTNRGGSWTKLTGTQFDRVTSVTFNPLQLTQAYLTTETQGLWISNNMNAATPTWSLVSNYDFRQPERVFFNPFNPAEMWVTSFGNGLKVGSVSGPVAVSIMNFSGTRDRNLSKLRWTTANEQACDVYEIERSTDGMNFEKIGSVTGNPGYNNHYNYEDNIAGSALYYRIKVNSISGNILYSNVVLLKSVNMNLKEIRLMQNPVTGNTIQLQTNMQETGELIFVLNDLSGKKIMSQTKIINVGINQLNLSLPTTCRNGIYVLRIHGMGIKKNIKLVLMK